MFCNEFAAGLDVTDVVELDVSLIKTCPDAAWVKLVCDESATGTEADELGLPPVEAFAGTARAELMGV
jgi:hypothetical protein